MRCGVRSWCGPRSAEKVEAVDKFAYASVLARLPRPSTRCDDDDPAFEQTAQMAEREQARQAGDVDDGLYVGSPVHQRKAENRSRCPARNSSTHRATPPRPKWPTPNQRRTDTRVRAPRGSRPTTGSPRDGAARFRAGVRAETAPAHACRRNAADGLDRIVGPPSAANAARCLISESRAKASGSKEGTTVGRSSLPASGAAGRSGGSVFGGGKDGIPWMIGLGRHEERGASSRSSAPTTRDETSSVRPESRIAVPAKPVNGTRKRWHSTMRGSGVRSSSPATASTSGRRTTVRLSRGHRRMRDTVIEWIETSVATCPPRGDPCLDLSSCPDGRGSGIRRSDATSATLILQSW